jgi:hypothetical protein
MLALVLFGAPLAARADTVLAIYPLQPLGVAQATVDSLDSAVRAQASRQQGVRLIGRGQTDATLHASLTGPALSCSGDAACLSDLGRLLGADLVAYVVVSRLSNGYSADLVLVDVARVAERRRLHVTLEGRDRERLLDDMRGATVQLLAPESYIAGFQLSTDTLDARVFLDGRYLARTPMVQAVTGLAPGAHRLRIVRGGAPEKPFEQLVELRFQRTLVMAVDLGTGTVTGALFRDGVEGLPAPAVEPEVVASSSHAGLRTAGWVASGAAVCFGALGLGSALIAHSNRNALAQQARPIPPELAATASTQLHRQHDFGLAADILFAGAGVAAVTAVVAFAVAGFSDPGPAPTAESTPPRGIGPWVGPAGAGLSVAGSF